MMTTIKIEFMTIMDMTMTDSKQNKKQLMNVSKKVSVTCLVMEIMIIPTITLIAVIQLNIGW